MRFARVALGTLVGTAMVVGSVAPAAARDRGWGGWGRDRHWHHDRDDFDFGDAVGIAALVGAVAIVASSLSKDRKASGKADDRPYDGGDGDYSDSSRRPGDDRQDDAGRADDQQGGETAALGDENAAVDACAVAARDQASEQGGYAEVREIGDPQPIDGGWNIDGSVEQRTGYRDTGGQVRRFTCTVKDGRVAEVYLSRDPATI